MEILGKLQDVILYTHSGNTCVELALGRENYECYLQYAQMEGLRPVIQADPA